jgi:hypothetical protein
MLTTAVAMGLLAASVPHVNGRGAMTARDSAVAESNLPTDGTFLSAATH